MIGGGWKKIKRKGMHSERPFKVGCLHLKEMGQ
jgi:hypothetical protein